jgi:hypothetical protein
LEASKSLHFFMALPQIWLLRCRKLMRDLGAGWCKRDFPLDGAAPIGLGGFGRCYFQFLIGADVVSVKSWVCGMVSSPPPPPSKWHLAL